MGSTSYKFTATLLTPVINVTVPSSLTVAINPYGMPINFKNADYDADGVTSPVYTIRNKTRTSAVSIGAKVYLTVPKDKSSELPTITVLESPDEVAVR